MVVCSITSYSYKDFFIMNDNDGKLNGWISDDWFYMNKTDDLWITHG